MSYPYLGTFCYRTTVEQFREERDSHFMPYIIISYGTTYPNDPSPGQIRAWRTSFESLQKTVEELPDSYNGLTLLFEYSLPTMWPSQEGFETHHGCRPDVILLSREHVIVIEYKDMALIPGTRNYDFCVRKARKYRQRIQRFHDSSCGMHKHAILVETQGSGYRSHQYKVEVCTDDRLGEILTDILGDCPQPLPDPEKWIHSTYSDRKKTDRVR